MKGDSNNHFALKGGDATKADGLESKYDGPRPNDKYKVMRKQGAIILGIGGDNSNWAVGTFYEGLMTQGFSSDEADQKVQENIAAAGYAFASEEQAAAERAFPTSAVAMEQTRRFEQAMQAKQARYAHESDDIVFA